MWSKAIKICLAAFVFVSAGLIIPSQQASANVIVSQLAKPVVRSLAEKAGMEMSVRQVDNAVAVINRKAMDGDQKAIDFIEGTKTLTPVGAGSKAGFNKYVVDPMLWLTGLDLVFEVIDLFQPEDVGTNVDMFKQCAPVNKTGVTITNNYSGSWTLRAVVVMQSTGKKNAIFSDNPITWGSYMGNITTGLTGKWAVFEETVSGSGNYDKVFNISNNVGEITGGWQITSKVYDSVTAPDVNCTVPVTEPDVITVPTEVSNTKTYFDNDTYDNDTTYNMEIEMPDNVTTYNYDNDTTIWNAPDPELELELGGGGDDGTDPPVTGDTDNDDGHGDSIDVLVRVDDEIPIHEKFFLEMADMGQKVEDMYNGVTHFFQVTTEGFESLTDGMTGYVAFLDDFFDWLPAPYVALLGSGFTLGVVSFFLRR